MDDLTRRGVRVSVALARTLGLRVIDPLVLRDVSNLLVHLRPAPVVARVATSTALARVDVIEHFRRAVDVTAYLAARGVPVVGASDELPAGPFTRDGMVVSFATWVPHDPAWVPTDFAHRLAELHAELAPYPGALPDRGPLTDVDAARDLWTRPTAELEAFTAVRDCLADHWPADDVQPLHGDAHPGNLLMTPRGPLWNDFEDTWRGPVTWDLACLALTGRLDGMTAAGDYPLPRGDLAFFLRLRRLQAAGWLTILERRFPEYRDAADEQLEAALVPPIDRRH